MAHVRKDRVKETSTTTGTGALALAGAVTGFQTFASAIGVGNTCEYAIVGPGGTWETGLGTLSGASTLQRTEVYESSNGGSAVAFPAGTKEVFVTLPASALAAVITALQAADGTKANLSGATFTGPVALDDSDLGTVTSGTTTFNYATKQNYQITINGAVTFAFSNLPTDGSGEMKIQILYTSGSIAFPSIKWAKGDGTKTTTFADLGITLTAGEAYELIVRYVRGQLQGVFG